QFMSLKEKFGQDGSNIRKVNILEPPDISMLQRLLSDLSIATTTAQCDVSWQFEGITYTLALRHSRQTARASWKLYRGQGMQAQLVWDHSTNDVSVVYRQVQNILKQPLPSQSQTRIIALKNPDIIGEERRAININSNLSGKLRKLFIGTQEYVIAGKQSLNA